MQKLARFAVHRRWYVVVGWLVLIIGLQTLSSAAGGASYKNDFALPHTESATVSALLSSAHLGSQNGASGTMVVKTKSGSVRDLTSTIRPALTAICNHKYGVVAVTSIWGQVSCAASGGAQQSGSSGASSSGGGAAQTTGLISKDSTLGLARITWSDAAPPADGVIAVHDQLAKLGNSKVQVEFTGDAFQALSQQSKGVPPEVFGIVAALIILVIVFRTLGATVLPLLSAVAALGTGLALISLLSHVMSVADFATQLATLMVLGVGIDYALFIVTRHRRNLLAGMSVRDSIAKALDTSGRAVLFAGITVCIALLGLLALGVSFLYGVAVGTAIAVALTMIASLTLLPAMLSFLGLKVLPRKQRAAVRAGTYVPSTRRGLWARWSTFVAGHRLAVGGAALIILAVLAIPFFSMRLGSSDQGTDPTSSTTRRGYDLIAQEFGAGFNSTLELVVHGPGASNPAYLQKVSDQLRLVPDVSAGSIAAFPVAKDIALVSFKSVTSPQDVRTTDLVKHLRSDVVGTMTAGTTNKVYVYGVTAIFVDFAKVLSAKMPLFFTAVIGLSFLLLMVAFRSVVVPLTAAAMNLVAAGAAFGVVVAVFQWGWLSNVLGTGGSGPIEPFIPVMFFAILFGLSMDYQVFLVSRMHEDWVHHRDNGRAVTIGQSETGGIITAAAIIMISVFGGFILGDQRVIKLFGIGLAGAIFLDAFVVRTLLVPSLMHQFGKANWWYPKALDRVTPRISIESAGDEDGPARRTEPEDALAGR